MTLTEQYQMLADLRGELSNHEAAASARSKQLKDNIAELQRQVNLHGAGIDLDTINLARTVIFVRGAYSRGGTDRKSVLDDAITEIATQRAANSRGLDAVNLGTKSYDRWSGQRCDCKPGCGPRHGSIVFQVGLTEEARKRGGVAALTDDEREAAIYMLSRLEAVQKAEAQDA